MSKDHMKLPPNYAQMTPVERVRWHVDETKRYAAETRRYADKARKWGYIGIGLALVALALAAIGAVFLS